MNKMPPVHLGEFGGTPFRRSIGDFAMSDKEGDGLFKISFFVSICTFTYFIVADVLPEDNILLTIISGMVLFAVETPLVYLLLSIVPSYFKSKAMKKEREEYEKSARGQTELSRAKRENDRRDDLVECGDKCRTAIINVEKELGMARVPFFELRRMEDFLSKARQSGAQSEEDFAIFARSKGVEPEKAVEWVRREQTKQFAAARAKYKKEVCPLEMRLAKLEERVRAVENRTSDLKRLEEEKAKAQLCGHDKYLGKVRDLIQSHKSSRALQNYASMQRRMDLSATANTHDPYLHGGIAEGIAGPAAGLAIASQINRENSKAEAEAAARRAGAEKRYEEFTGLIDLAYKDLPSEGRLKWIEESVIDRLIDSDHPEKYLSAINVTEKGRTITESGSLEVVLGFEAKEDVLLLGNPVVIDGSIEVSAIVDGKVFANGYVIAPGKDVTDFYGSEDVGFAGCGEESRQIECKALLVPMKCRDSFEADTDYTLEFTPFHIWAVQKGENAGQSIN